MVVNKITMPSQPNRRFFAPRKMASDFSDATNGNEIPYNISLNKMPRSTVTTTSQLQTNSQSSTTTSRLAKTSVSTSSSSTQRLHHVSTSSTSDRKASSMKADLNEFKNNINEMKSLSNIGNINEMKSLSNMETLGNLKRSLDNLVEDDSEPIVTFPDDTPLPSELVSPTNPMDTMKFEQTTNHNFSATKVVKDGMTAEKASTKLAEKKLMQTGDISYEEKSNAMASHARLEVDGITAEKSLVKANCRLRLSIYVGGDASGDQDHVMVYIASRIVFRIQQTTPWAGVRQVPFSIFSWRANSNSTNRSRIVVVANANKMMSAPWPVRKGAYRSSGQSDTPLPNGVCLQPPPKSRKQLKTSTSVNHEKMEARSLITGDVSQQESKNMAHTTMKLTTDTFSSEQTATEASEERQRITSSGIYNKKNHSSSQTFMATKGMSTTTSSILTQIMNGTQKTEEELLNMTFEDLEQLSGSSNQQDVDKAIEKYSACLNSYFKILQRNELGQKASVMLTKVHEIMIKAWAVPKFGHELGYSLCNTLRKCGGLDLLMVNCTKNDKDLQFHSAQLLEQCLTTENRGYVVENGLDRVVNVACVCTKNPNSVAHSRVGTGILEHLFKHSEETCSSVVRLGGLDALLFECRKSDVETLRHCACALANLSLYGGAENQEAMINRKVPMWLFPLAFHTDDNIKYYACLAITVLVANAEIEAQVLQSGTLGLVEPFVTTHNPSEFATSNLSHAHGQSTTWLQHLVPVLSSKREEARNLAAFHFCMEAGIKKQQANTNIFYEIDAIDSLKKVASCPNAVASKYAAQALRLIGEEVPHKLSQQVPLWSALDVEEWVKQIGFVEIAAMFAESRVDGDLLLQLTEDNLKEDIGLKNGIKRRRFERELHKLKKMADYSSRDSANINTFLQTMGPEFSIYTYAMLNAGVETKDSLRGLSEDQLANECGITNSIHRTRIMNSIKTLEMGYGYGNNEDCLDKPLDVFVSYRRSNGSQLASLLKVHLQLRGFSVFIDVERLEAGKFDNNLLQSIQKAKHFLLVLTPKALDRCIKDSERKDWVHREIVAALQAHCNIIPIIDNFQWPEAEELPEDMRQVCHFNGVRWIHDYQDACVDKLERFMRGELNSRTDGGIMRLNKGDMTPGTPSTAGIVRQPPSYQRMHSNDSGSGKGSDKDVNGNSGMPRD